MKNFEVIIEGLTPLLHHKMGEEVLLGLLGKKSKKLADKQIFTPREIAEQAAYKSKDGSFYIPLAYVSGAFAYTAGDYKQANKGRKSIKAIAGGVFRPLTENATLIDEKGKPLKSFEVDIKKGNNFKAGAVCVCRPRFDRWRAKFTIVIDEEILSPETALQIMEDSGRRAGIGSFRVNKGGYYGQFQVLQWKEVKSDLASKIRVPKVKKLPEVSASLN